MSKMNDEVQAIPLVDLVEDTDNFHTKKPSSIDSKSLCFIFLGSTFMTLLIALIVSLSSNAYDKEEATRPFYYYQISDPEAVCNNGERASYYVRPAVSGSGKDGNGKENIWIVRFEGGNICFSPESCEARWAGHDHEFMLPKEDATAFQDLNGGLLSEDPLLNPFWHDVNAVYIHYCSSDGWTGNSSPEENGSRFYFRGSKIVDGVLKDLVARNGMDKATHILLAGFSAGGMMIVNSASRMVSYLNTVVPNAVKKVLCDSGYFMISKDDFTEIEGWGTCSDFTNCGFKDQFRIGYPFWKSVIPTACAAATGRTYECLFAEYNYPYITEAPILFAQHQYDVMHLLTAGLPVGDYTYSASAWEYAQYYRSYIVNSLTNTVDNVWSSGCHVHDTTNHDWFTNIKLIQSQQNLDTRLYNWFFMEEQGMEFDPCIDSADIKCNPSSPPVDATYLPSYDPDAEE